MSNHQSTPYPFITLGDAINFAGKARKQLRNSSADRTLLTQSLGYNGVNNGKARRVISSLVQFGLFERANDLYRFTELSAQILKPIDEESRTHAIKEALYHPELYSALLNEYNPNDIPEALPNILIRRYGIADKTAEKAAQVFRQSIDQSGILSEGLINEKKLDYDTEINDHSGEKKESKIDPTEEITINVKKVKIIFPTIYSKELIMGVFATAFKELEAALTRLNES